MTIIPNYSQVRSFRSLLQKPIGKCIAVDLIIYPWSKMETNGEKGNRLSLLFVT